MSRYLSYLLRHGATKEGLNIDKEGFISVTELLNFLNFKGSDINTFEQLQKITKADAKQRFLLVERDGIWFMRANQGHSISSVTEDAVTLITNPDEYPEVIHGTFRKNLELIKMNGLSRMKRNHIHLSSSMDASSGIRKNGNVFIHIDIHSAMNDGIKFFISDNGVILTPGNENGILEPKYFKLISDAKGNNLLIANTQVKQGYIPCAGCLVFRLRDDVKEICVISTHDGVYGFPKGKREKGEDIVKCALRELEEETGITPNDITPLQDDKYVDEVSRSGNSIAIRLFVTTLTNDVILQPEDIGEINKCEFLPVDTALSLLMPKRQDVLRSALALL